MASTLPPTAPCASIPWPHVRQTQSARGSNIASLTRLRPMIVNVKTRLGCGVPVVGCGPHVLQQRAKVRRRTLPSPGDLFLLLLLLLLVLGDVGAGARAGATA